MEAEVFISYSHKDQEQVTQLVERLQSAGVTAWIDHRGIEGATLWPEVIAEAIASCKVVILMVSSTSMATMPVTREVMMAGEANKPILPLVLEPATIPSSIQYYLTGIQKIDLCAGADDQVFSAILQSLARWGVHPRDPREVRRRAPTDPLDIHCGLLIKGIVDGRLVPFLGTEINVCGRPVGTVWAPGQCLPSSSELATHLARSFGYPSTEATELVRVSQYVAVMTGSGPLYEELHGLLDADYPPTALHLLLASLPAALRDKGYPPRHQLIVTTNYDDVLERAFEEAGEPFDLVSYVAVGEHRGKFWHRSPDGATLLIEKPNEYGALSLDKRTVILKVHGAVDRTDPERDSFVITEDHYIDYLTRADISNLLPITLAAKLRRSHFLFLGYSLRDWNLRVILHRLWGEQKLSYKSWAIQLAPPPIDQEFWRKRDVETLDVGLEEYTAALSERVRRLPPVRR